MTAENVEAATVASVDALGRRRLALPAGVAFAGTSAAFAGLYLAAGAPTPILLLLQQRWGFPSWALTVAFASYAITLIAALLVTGRLSDHIGRRPVIIAALAVQVLAMLGFVFATNVGWVIVARSLQGLATGMATSAFTAAIIELAPSRFARLASIVTGTAAVAGLALGALFAGLAVQFSTSADGIVFVALAVVAALGLLVAVASPETSSVRAGAVRSLVPQASVPRSARGAFVAATPAIVGAWMLAALFLGLGPSVVLDVFHINSGAVDGATAFAEPAAAALAGFVLGGMVARKAIAFGALAVLLGTAIVVAGVFAASLMLFVAGGVVAGVGFGAIFSGALRAVTPLVLPHERAGVFAAVFTVAYLSFGLPAMVSGLLIGWFGLTGTVVGFGVAVMLAAAVGLAAQMRATSRERAARRPATGVDAAPCSLVVVTAGVPTAR
ncbi:MFS transporter [Humibacter ginsenosidimutans]|uniref:MFS transporter n=1 Tax=Humibacter ginsenosidimutans TaxID=2599293 RepID=A0A5B8M4E0_9MICO|nr:MFS transporter [Humibacter ginsenosidimutans]QDZ15176.1 MFS transporter [Humibacter ginsenosidimutans]